LDPIARLVAYAAEDEAGAPRRPAGESGGAFVGEALPHGVRPCHAVFWRRIEDLKRIRIWPAPVHLAIYGVEVLRQTKSVDAQLALLRDKYSVPARHAAQDFFKPST
jgi:hypothetical protein